ncbi:hypothetical protein G5I_07194 [Acromyrmex echinatior]|uniref:Uncharacterized protein n=1 Tax=Acromyrmex echinatior TaxID=103372 RepID=F4WN47_ACREC|nr:hypothetical protein G5I_07194 [Acromyrmex echinatior]
MRARLNFRRRHKLPSTARKQIIFSAHRVCAAKGRRGETAAAYVASSFEDSSTSSSLRVPAVRPTPNIVVSVRVIPEMAEQQMPEKQRFGDSRSRATGTSENAKKLSSLSPLLKSRDFENSKRRRQLNIRRTEKNSLCSKV